MDIKTKKFGRFISESLWKRRWRKFRVYTFLENRKKSWKLKSYGKVGEINKNTRFLMFSWMFTIINTKKNSFEFDPTYFEFKFLGFLFSLEVGLILIG
jgi:hypothetical protein